MIKAMVDNEKMQLEIKGNIIDILNNITNLVSGIYEELPEEIKGDFSYAYEQSVKDGLYRKSDEERIDLIEKKPQKNKDIEKFIKGLKDLLE